MHDQRPEEPSAAVAYDQFAAAYAADNETNAFNALYERPAMLALLGEVSGKRVLDAGCGAGALAEALLQRGAVVTGLELSERMAELARRRLGARATVHVGDLARPLTRFADGSFDLIAASLVLHYLEYWEPTLREFARVLVPGGAVALSTHHPTMDWQLAGGSYFATRRITETWRKGGEQATVTFWRRPLTAMVAAFHASGFLIDDLVEPMPVKACAERFPEEYAKLTTAPRFLFFRLVKRHRLVSSLRKGS
ncbi:MAG: class I SAM-dependent methyltransferase [Chloroflexota bacterium]